MRDDEIIQEMLEAILAQNLTDVSEVVLSFTDCFGDDDRRPAELKNFAEIALLKAKEIDE